MKAVLLVAGFAFAIDPFNRDAVAKAIAAGQTVEQAQAGILMDNYKGWEFYDQQRPQNVAGTYRALTSNR